MVFDFLGGGDSGGLGGAIGGAFGSLFGGDDDDGGGLGGAIGGAIGGLFGGDDDDGGGLGNAIGGAIGGLFGGEDQSPLGGFIGSLTGNSGNGEGFFGNLSGALGGIGDVIGDPGAALGGLANEWLGDGAGNVVTAVIGGGDVMGALGQTELVSDVMEDLPQPLPNMAGSVLNGGGFGELATWENVSTGLETLGVDMPDSVTDFAGGAATALGVEQWIDRDFAQPQVEPTQAEPVMGQPRPFFPTPEAETADGEGMMYTGGTPGFYDTDQQDDGFVSNEMAEAIAAQIPGADAELVARVMQEIQSGDAAGTTGETPGEAATTFPADTGVDDTDILTAPAPEADTDFGDDVLGADTPIEVDPGTGFVPPPIADEPVEVVSDPVMDAAVDPLGADVVAPEPAPVVEAAPEPVVEEAPPAPEPSSFESNIDNIDDSMGDLTGDGGM